MTLVIPAFCKYLPTFRIFSCQISLKLSMTFYFMSCLIFWSFVCSLIASFQFFVISMHFGRYYQHLSKIHFWFTSFQLIHEKEKRSFFHFKLKKNMILFKILIKFLTCILLKFATFSQKNNGIDEHAYLLNAVMLHTLPQYIHELSVKMFTKFIRNDWNKYELS